MLARTLPSTRSLSLSLSLASVYVCANVYLWWFVYMRNMCTTFRSYAPTPLPHLLSSSSLLLFLLNPFLIPSNSTLESSIFPCHPPSETVRALRSVTPNSPLHISPSSHYQSTVDPQFIDFPRYSHYCSPFLGICFNSTIFGNV